MRDLHVGQGQLLDGPEFFENRGVFLDEFSNAGGEAEAVLVGSGGGDWYGFGGLGQD